MTHATTPTEYTTPDAAHAADHGHAPEPFAPQVKLPTMAMVHIVIGLVITYAGLFTMMTVAFAAYGATLASIGPAYVALMLGRIARDAPVE